MKTTETRCVVLTRPRCLRGASRSLTASFSDEFSWDSAPWSSLSFFARLQPPHSLPLLFFFGITKEKKYNEENQTRCMPNKILLQVLFRGCSRPSLGVQGRSDRSGFLFEGMLTRNRRGSPPVFFIWLHQQPSVGQHHVTENSVKHTRWHAYFLLPYFKIKHYS